MNNDNLLPQVRAFLKRAHGNFVEGLSEVGGGEAIDIINPADGSVVGIVKSATQQQANLAMLSAEKALGVWRNMPTLQRGALLLKLADKLAQEREALAQIESVCSGKTIQLARMLEVEQSIAFLRYFAGWAGKINGETLDVSLPSFAGEKYTAFTRRQPVGVVVGIIPWNFSIMIAIWKLAAALVCGCTVVLKPSEYTPLTLLRVAELATECGFPAGVINVINGRGAGLGAYLIEHPACAKISFTGSVATGQHIKESATKTGKKLTLELGGKNAALFFDDLNEDEIVNGIMEAGYLNQGQICAAAENIWLPASRIEAVLAKLKARLAAVKIGDPLDDATEMGPIANKAQYDKILNLIEKAKADGDEIIYGGQSLDKKGYFVQPTAIRAASFNSQLLSEETFGPVCSFIAYHDEEEALQKINASPFGLSASVWSHNISKALRVSERLEAGMVWINMHTFLDPAVPFGGMKGSGIGREFGSAFIEDYTELKSIMVRY